MYNVVNAPEWDVLISNRLCNNGVCTWFIKSGSYSVWGNFCILHCVGFIFFLAPDLVVESVEHLFVVVNINTGWIQGGHFFIVRLFLLVKNVALDDQILVVFVS